MLDVLKKIFIEYNFGIEDNIQAGFLALREETEYFFVVDYSEAELENFFECDKTDRLLEVLKKKAENYSDIRKNASVIINSKADNLERFFREHRNIIFKIEEDEFYFRKYIVVYTEDTYKQLALEKNVGKKINSILLSEEGIDEFQMNYFTNELYHVAMQLMVKLPFLTLKQITREYIPLNQILEEEIKKKGLNDFYLCLEAFDELDCDFDSIEKAILLEEYSYELTDFFASMEVIKE